MLDERSLNDTFADCKPWETGRLQDNTNLLNNLKENLKSYEKVYKKYSIKAKSQLPQIKITGPKFDSIRKRKRTIDKSKMRTLDAKNIKETTEKKQNNYNKSMELHSTKSQLRMAKSREFHQRGLTAMETIEKENKELKETVVTERQQKMERCMSNLKSKIYLMNFDEQNKYRRLRKRQLHQIIFGGRKKQQSREKINQLR